MYQYPDYLMHYGIPGMKWGVRKARKQNKFLTKAAKKRALKDSKTKWGKAKRQPSSLRSSSLAGTYAATGNKRVGEKLDKSNDKDAVRWLIAKRASGVKISDLRKLGTTLDEKKVEELLDELEKSNF